MSGFDDLNLKVPLILATVIFMSRLYFMLNWMSMKKVL